MKYFSMFSGIGGFELGIEKATKNKNIITKHSRDRKGTQNLQERGNSPLNEESSFECIGYSEIDKYAIQTYEKNFPENRNYGDCSKINPNNLPNFELLCGGFPCQAFSIAGKRLGFEDTRGTLFYEIARIIKVKRPKIVFLENVKGLLNHDKGRTFATILATFDELGYNVEWECLNSKYFGVPQNRERVFIIGHFRGESSKQIFPLGEDGKEFNEKSRFQETGNISKCLTARYWKMGQSDQYISDDSKIRKLTPIECERLQGFPDNWTKGVSDTQRYKQLGNAVTVNVIQTIMEKLWKQIRNTK